MRNYLLTIGFIACCFFVKGQSTVRLNIVLNHVQNLTVNASQESTTLTYNTVEDYKKGVEVVQKEHLNVFSTSPFVVKVKVENEDFVQLGADQQNRMRLPNISVRATSAEQGSGMILEQKILSAQDAALITADNPLFNHKFDVTYTGPGDNEMIKYSEFGKLTTYTNVVMYSIEAK